MMCGWHVLCSLSTLNVHNTPSRLLSPFVLFPTIRLSHLRNNVRVPDIHLYLWDILGL